MPSAYGNVPIRHGENTNNQFLSSDILGAQSKIVPPPPPIYSPTAPPTQPPIYSQGKISPNYIGQAPGNYSEGIVGSPGQFLIPSGPSTQDYY